MEKSLKYSFETSNDRSKTNSIKYKWRKKLFGSDDIIPLWVADMDIDSPKFIKDAIAKRVSSGIYGYEQFPQTAFEAQISWLHRKYGTDYETKDMFYSHSVVASMSMVIEAFSDKGDEIIVSPPIYPPFFKEPKRQGRKVVFNNLQKDKDGVYRYDIDDLKSCITKKTKLLFLCNPANPVGRAWSKKELDEILQICIKNDIIIFSDEVHCDLVYEPFRHTAMSTIQGASDITISAYGIGKTFNLSGLATSTLYIQNHKLYKKFKKVYDKNHISSGNCLSHIAFETVYRYGEVWLDELKIHLLSNYNQLKNLIDKYPQYLCMTPMEATYLCWIDCSGMGKTDQQIAEFFIAQAKLGLSRGSDFGDNAKQHMRLNFAISTQQLNRVLKQLDYALANMR